MSHQFWRHWKWWRATTNDVEIVAEEEQEIPKAPPKICGNSIYTFNLKSSIAKMVVSVVGIYDNLKQFDKHHIIYKYFRYESSRKIWSTLLPALQQKVKHTYLKLKDEVQSWGKMFFFTHNKQPDVNDYKNEPHIYECFKKVNYGKKLLQIWKLEQWFPYKF